MVGWGVGEWGGMRGVCLLGAVTGAVGAWAQVRWHEKGREFCLHATAR